MTVKFNRFRLADGMVAWLRGVPYRTFGITLLAAASVVMAGGKVSDLAGALSKKAQSAEHVELTELVRDGVSLAEYENIAKIIRSNIPDVIAVASKTGLVVEIDDAAKYHEWIYALTTAAAYNRGMAWEAVELCVGEGCGKPASVTLRAFVQRIVVGSAEKR